MSGTTDTVTRPCSYNSAVLADLAIDVYGSASGLQYIGRVESSKSTVTFGSPQTVGSYRYFSVGF